MRASRNWTRAAGCAFLALSAFGPSARATGIAGESGDFHRLIPLMRAHDPALTVFEVKERVRLNQAYDLVLFQGRGANDAKSYSGVFVVASATNIPHMTLDVVRAEPSFYGLRVDEATERSVVITRLGLKPYRGPRFLGATIRYELDLATRALERRMRGWLPVLQRHDREWDRYAVLERRKIDDRHSVVLLVAGKGRRNYDSYAVFVAETAGDRPVMPVVVFRGESHYIRVLEAWHDFVIVDRVGTYGGSFGRTKYRIDLDRRKVVDAVEYEPYPVRAIVSGDALFLFVTRRNGPFITQLNSLAATDYRVYARLGGQKIGRIKAVRQSDDGLVLRTEGGAYLFRAGQWRPLADDRREGGPGRFAYQRGGTRYEVHAAEDGITMRSGGDVAHYPLPQADYDLFARLRPARVRDGYPREHTFIEEAVGPSYLRGPRLWFGYDFYDGEGMSGVGGIGYFDLARRRYEIRRLPKVIGWSVSAIFVERDAVWAGLYGRPEGAEYRGGLIRYRLPDGPVEEIDVPKIVNSVTRWGPYIACGTSDGAYLVRDDGTLIRITWDENSGTATPSPVIRSMP